MHCISVTVTKLCIINFVNKSNGITIFCLIDYPGLKNCDVIEDLRRQVLSAFRAYTTGKSYGCCLYKLCFGLVCIASL